MNDPVLPDATPAPGISRSLVLLMAFGCGMSVANMYYNQPLLAQMAASFHVNEKAIGAVPLLTQMGTALGMLLFVPLGDIAERRGLILRLLLVVTLALTLTAFAPSLPVLCLLSAIIGMTSTVPHLLLPFAAQLARPEERGRVVGSVLSGLLIGILLARTVSGCVGTWFGWRAMYGFAAILMIGLAAVLRRFLPQSIPTANLRWRDVLAGLPGLVRELPTLRQASLIGAATFGAFQIFWSTLVFHLAGSPFRFAHPSTAAGLFGLVGVVGAGIAPLAGRVADQRSPRFTLGIALAISLLAYAIFGVVGASLIGLIVGVILLDFGVQAAHVANQTRIYALRPEARSRLNTVYMVSYFIGGSLGAWLGALGWSQAGWSGVCVAGSAFLLAALAIHVAFRP